MAESIEEKMVFAVVPPIDPDTAPLVLCGIPAQAWEYMRDGKTHSFDLTRAGVHVRLLIYGAEDHTAAMKLIEDFARTADIPFHDRRREDFSIKGQSDG